MIFEPLVAAVESATNPEVGMLLWLMPCTFIVTWGAVVSVACGVTLPAPARPRAWCRAWRARARTLTGRGLAADADPPGRIVLGRSFLASAWITTCLGCGWECGAGLVPAAAPAAGQHEISTAVSSPAAVARRAGPARSGVFLTDALRHDHRPAGERRND